MSRIQNLQRERDALLEQAASKDVEIKRLTKKLKEQLSGKNKAKVGFENLLKKK